MKNRSMLTAALSSALCVSAWVSTPVTLGQTSDLLQTAPATQPTTVPDITADEMRQSGERASDAAARLGWRLGLQAWTYNRRSFYDAIDMTRALGLHYIEAFPNQVVDKDKKIKMGPGLSKDTCEQIKQRLADADVKLINFGVTSLSKDEATSRKTFDFAKEMGIETIVSEPPEDAFDTLDKLTSEYGINVAIHDHPKPSHYWNPDTVLRVIAGHNPHIGDCADVGHWQRSGVNPIEALQKLKGHIISSHFKDLNSFDNPKAIDVPWGTGTGNAKAMLEEIHRQNIKLAFSIEYEHYSPRLTQEVAQSIKWFGDTCEAIAKE